jgi:hypothetical protein
MKKRLWIEDDEEFYDEGPSVGQEGLEVDGVDFLPMHTGVLNARGEPILRHPMVIRMGFHKEENKYHCPTIDDGEFPGSVRVFGWVYDVN